MGKDERESLSQLATQEILQVISQSRHDEEPVFDVILKAAQRLCNAPLAFLSLANEARTHVRIPAQRGAKPKFANVLKEFLEPIERSELLAVRPVVDPKVIMMDDIADHELYRQRDARRVQMVEVEGVRSVLVVPLIKEGQGIGAITLYRREVSPFSEGDVNLVQNFAAQAVIAIENVRQFRELQVRLEREAASAEILKVISQSRDDDLPVFDTIVRNAAQLCGAARCGLHLLNKEQRSISFAAMWGEASEEFVPGLFSYDVDDPIYTARSIRELARFHIPDLADDELYHSGYEFLRKIVDEVGYRTLLSVPLILGDAALGTIAVWRTELKPFSEDEIALVETFAAQAVIAIENVRQFKALEALNAELGQRVDEQVGEIERMGRLKRFLPSAVADAVVTTGDESMLSSHRALIATLFCDMRGFTAFCEAAEPEETIEVLQTYHQEMSELIDQYGGGVDQRAGDGIMVIFNDPIPVDDPAGDAIRLAIAMRAKMRELCAGWKKLGHRLGFGIGIAMGYATVGMVGSAGRFDYTASGTSVNTAARLCDMAEHDEILISPRTWAAVEGDVQAKSRGEVEMKGIREPVEVFALLAD